jgi:type IV pilus assembly protein PilW
LRHPTRRVHGFSLVELLVAMVISLALVFAAVATLLMGSRGYATVESSAQLQQNVSFVLALIGRVTAQAGFQDAYFATRPASVAETASANPAIAGFNNATVTKSAGTHLGTITSTHDPVDTVYAKPWRAGQSGFGSDVLVVRYQLASRGADDPQSDGSMVDCSGGAPRTPSASRDDTTINVLFIAEDDDGEPVLSCYTLDDTPTSQRMRFEQRVGLVKGVENFQVLYGVQAKAPVVPNAAFVSSDDSITRAYLRADQMVVGNDPRSLATLKNWQLVRSLRIGVVLRSDVNKQQQTVAQVFYPLGVAKSSVAGAVGSAFASAADPGSIFNAPADGRFRAVETFTIHLRNAQGL